MLVRIVYNKTNFKYIKSFLNQLMQYNYQVQAQQTVQNTAQNTIQYTSQNTIQVIPQEAATLSQLLNCISNLLEEILLETDLLESPFRSVFHSPKPPAISISNYLIRIAKYSGCSEQSYLLALIYIDRLQELNPEIVVNSLCVHRFILTAVMIAIKWHDDEYYKNEYYAKIGGVNAKEMNALESEFLKLMGFKLFVNAKLFENYTQKIQQIIGQ